MEEEHKILHPIRMAVATVTGIINGDGSTEKLLLSSLSSTAAVLY
jgi:hypothetical protein